MNLHSKIKNKTASVAVVGLGYVGLPLAVEFAKKGFKVIGIDTSYKKVCSLNLGKSYVSDVKSEDIKEIIGNEKFIATTDYSRLNEADAISICVPTPLNKNHEPDLSYVNNVVDLLKQHMKLPVLITLESTTYPGTTEEIIELQLNNHGYKVGEDYFLCFSPERIDPGNKEYNIKNTPKVVGGTTSECLRLASELYGSIIETIVPVSSTRVAEMSKLLENTFRSINIAFINEIALMCDSLSINIWEVIKAASSKPFGYTSFFPGPGIGGHCIPLDPAYLYWKAKGVNFFSKFIELSQEINKSMPKYVVNKVTEALNLNKKCINGAKILLLGMAYKPDISDLRESPSFEVYELIKEKDAIITVNDPYSSSFIDKRGVSVSIENEVNYNKLATFDCVVLLTAHSCYDYKKILHKCNLIVDTRNVFDNLYADNIVRIGDSIKNCIKKPHVAS